jgi:hypothetical protein
VGLDSTFAVITETVTLNGTTAVPTALLTWFRILYMEVMTVGSGGQNAGAITLRVLSAGATREQIPIGYNMSTSCRTTVPLGKVFYMTGWIVSHQELAASRYRLRATWNRNAKTANAGAPSSPHIFKVLSTLEILASLALENFDTPTCFPEGTDIDVVADNPGVTTFAASGGIHGTFLDA